MILVVQNEIRPRFRYLGAEIPRFLPPSTEYILPDNDAAPSLAGVDALVISGSTAGVYERADRPWIDTGMELVCEAVDREIPTLGICFGHQLVNAALGGAVEHKGPKHRFVEPTYMNDPLFENVSAAVPAVHGDMVTEAGQGMDAIASLTSDQSDSNYDYPLFATRHESAPVWTVQFHPELTDRVFDRIVADFGWTETDVSIEDVDTAPLFSNFCSLADVQHTVEHTHESV